MTDLLFISGISGASHAILKTGSPRPTCYYAVPVGSGTAQVFDPDSKIGSRVC
jgi:hypothetical protein